jgi:hypothetical protein
LILSGEPEALTYTFYFAGLWILIYGMSLRLERRKWIQILILCSAMAALACLVGALQVWPTLNFLSRTVRPMGLSPSAFAKTFVPLEQVLYPGVYIFSCSRSPEYSQLERTLPEQLP